MKDKVLQRKMFRQKALKKYGGDMLPKFEHGGMHEEQGPLDSGLAGLRKVFGPNFLNVTGEDKSTEPSINQPYDSKQAMLLAVAGRLLQAEQRPGEGMFSGVGRGVGKAITEDFPIINKLKLEDRATRLKALKDSTAVNKTAVYDITEGKNTTVAFADIASNPDRYMKTLPEKFDFTTTEDFTIDIGDGEKEYKQNVTNRIVTPEQYYNVFYNDKFKDFRKLIIAPEGDISRQVELNAQKKLVNEFSAGNVAVNERGRAALKVADLVSDALYNIEKGALTGAVADVNQFIGNVKGFFKPFIRKTETFDNPYSEQVEDMEAFLSGSVKLYSKDKNKMVGINEIFGNDKVAAMSADQRTLVTELAYAVAKSREEGGRFSVSDIELALKSIGDYSSPEQAKAALLRLGSITTQGNLSNMREFYNTYEDKGLKGDMYSAPSFIEDLAKYYSIFSTTAFDDKASLRKLFKFKDRRFNIYGGDIDDEKETAIVVRTPAQIAEDLKNK